MQDDVRDKQSIVSAPEEDFRMTVNTTAPRDIRLVVIGHVMTSMCKEWTNALVIQGGSISDSGTHAGFEPNKSGLSLLTNITFLA